MDEQVWHFVRDGKQWGPLTTAELREMVETGDLSSDVLVWRQGMSDWQPMHLAVAPEIDELGPLARSQPVAPGGVLNYHTPQPKRPMYAGFWLRAAALIIDYVSIYLIALAVALIGIFFELDRVAESHAPLPQIVIIITLAMYFAFMESSSWQGTLGKIICGIVVTDVNGQRISFGRALGRFAAKCLSAGIFYIGFIMAAFTQRKQALHDLIAGTVVRPRQS